MSPKHGKNIGRLAGAALLAVAAVWPARADYPGTVLSHNPLAYWQFNETAASPAPYKLANSGSVGSAGDAYAIPSVTNGVARVAGNAVLFSNPTGTAHAGSRVEVVYNPGLNPAVFSIEFWAQPSAFTLSTNFDATGSCPISNFNPNNSGSSRVGWLFYLAPTGKWNFRMGLASGYAVNIMGSAGLATANTWQHMVATYDGNVVNLYANGVLIGSQASAAASTGWQPNTGSFLRFGATPLNGDESLLYTDSASGNQYILPFNESINTAGNRGWDGLLDEVAIYPNALPAATVAAHYAAATTNTAGYHAQILADNPAGYWSFDEPAVTRPDPSAFPIAANAGSLGSDADGTSVWGAAAAQPGPGYSGFAAGNKAVVFDGLSGSFTVKDAPGLHFTGNITLAAWVKPTARDGLRDIISHGLDESGSEKFLRITRGDNYGTGYYYEVGACDGFVGEYYDSVQLPIPAGDVGNWVFLAGTFDGANWNLYRNGVLQGSTPAYTSATDQDTGALDVTNT